MLSDVNVLDLHSLTLRLIVLLTLMALAHLPGFAQTRLSKVLCSASASFYFSPSGVFRFVSEWTAMNKILHY